MIVEKIVVGALATNCYIIASDKSSKAVVIDPGADGPVILQRLQELDLRLGVIINTHGHHDHTGADRELVDEYQVPVYMGSDDINIVNDPSANLSYFTGGTKSQVEPVKGLADKQILEIDGLKLQTIETPGHTKGSISLRIQNKLFTGDLLFQGSIGRTDFPSSSYDDMLRSLAKIAKLPDETIVYPGHGPETVLGEEKRSNPFLREVVK